MRPSFAVLLALALALAAESAARERNPNRRNPSNRPSRNKNKKPCAAARELFGPASRAVIREQRKDPKYRIIPADPDAALVACSCDPCAPNFVTEFEPDKTIRIPAETCGIERDGLKLHIPKHVDFIVMYYIKGKKNTVEEFTATEMFPVIVDAETGDPVPANPADDDRRVSSIYCDKYLRDTQAVVSRQLRNDPLHKPALNFTFPLSASRHQPKDLVIDVVMMSHKNTTGFYTTDHLRYKHRLRRFQDAWESSVVCKKKRQTGEDEDEDCLVRKAALKKYWKDQAKKNQ